MATTALAPSTTQIPTAPDGRTLWWCEQSKLVTGGTALVCFPRFLEVAGWFKGVQRAVNDYRAKRGLAPIRVDAQIGPDTVTAVNQYRTDKGLPPLDHNGVALASQNGKLAQEIAAAAGASANIDPSPKNKPEEVPTVMPPAPEKSSNLKWWLLGGAIVLAAAGTGWYFYRRSKGKPMFAFAGPEIDGDDDDYDGPDLANVIDV